MRPEISNFVRELTYEELLDAPGTLNRPNLRGVESNIVFVDHTHLEEEASQAHELHDGGSKFSKKNMWVLLNFKRCLV
jgi:hypothetical protein